MKNRLLLTSMSIFLASVFVTSCAKAPTVLYHPDDFINPNKVITKKVPMKCPTPKVQATYGYGNDPLVVRAYHQFIKNGKMANIHSPGFDTIAYDAHSHPILACEPLHLCVMQLEAGERINNIELGDFAHWLVHTSLVGTQMQGSYQIAIKPKDYNIATDMVVTTNQRSYHVGLVSHKGSATHVMNFYYPEETLQLAIAKAKATSHQAIQPNIIDNHTHINALQLHFNYQLQGCKPAWRPVRVFDDGDKTFIEMPPIAERLDLPVLYIEREKGMQLINYRYRRPYYIVDALFKRAYLITGKGRKQTKVIIDNNNIKA